jgi:acyl carrier protein phosphodiesterase
MNYLAHALLAGPLATDRVGGVAGDFVKGLLQPCPAWLAAALAEGVRLHRRIDSFADMHPTFRRSRARVSDARRRFGGVLVDMFYDHFLAAHWPRFSTQPLTAFTAETYRQIKMHGKPLPEAFGPVFARMAAQDWLASYRESSSVALALDRMAQYRLRQPNPLAGAGEELLQECAGLETDLLAFLPDALAFAEQVRRAR